MHQRVFLAVRDPDLAGAGGRDGRGQPVPVGMIRNHQRQFDAALPGAGPHPHPARGERRHRIGKAPGPDVRRRRRRRQRDGAGEIGFLHALDRTQFAERDAAALIVRRDLLHRAMQIDRRVVAGQTQQRDHALRLAERIGADQMRALRKQRHRRQQLLHLIRRIAMAEHRQAKRRFGDEDVARHHLERRAGRIGRVLVIAGRDDAGVLAGHRDLRRAQHVAGGVEFDRDVAELDLLAVSDRLRACRAKLSP